MEKRSFRIGNVGIGAGQPVSVQTMTTAKTEHFDEALAEIRRAFNAGADIVRVAVADERDVSVLPRLVAAAPCPIVADIHFDHRLAIASVEAGAAKIRINPGNMRAEHLGEICACLKANGVPVRVGSNTGSIEKKFLEKYGRSARALAESALAAASVMEGFGVENIVLSAKASDVPTAVSAAEILADKGFPLHLGVTEAGFGREGVIKGAMGIGSLLLKGIGDTVRVSLTAPVEEEVAVARDILRAAGLDDGFVEVISCPTCGRRSFDVRAAAEEVKKRTAGIRRRLKVAVMGCVVNGVGEGSFADVGIAGGKGECAVFSGGKVLKKVPADRAADALMEEIERLLSINRPSD